MSPKEKGKKKKGGLVGKKKNAGEVVQKGSDTELERAASFGCCRGKGKQGLF